ncbi:hypothetical protein PFNF135_00680 [Plasmodium falciparum NF135/5.C10]|uniref:Surface antigen n=1 Tax=Plasmodium falciparum NF135/5.C10 TaxID=1036726 RepID=W4IP39_PLAFA|nr:hypothetical protein PFNF135_00680 [Plasmodium falciparum NF135/5.C10]
MNIYYVEMLLFTFLINTLALPHYDNYQNSHYNINLIQYRAQRTTINSRLLAQTKNHNPHYHNDPELKEIIDKMNEEAIKKYQQTHDPYKQLKDVVEKNGTKYTGGKDAEPMSTLEKELLETYEEMFGNESDMLKSGMSPNVDEKSSTCECTDINGVKLAKTKGRDKYLKHLKGRCTRGIYFCSVGSAILTMIGLGAAKTAALNYVATTPAPFNACASSINIYNMIAGGSTCSPDLIGTAAASASAIFEPCGIAALVLLILAVVLIILYIWLYRRRKNSWKHECKKHLCKNHNSTTPHHPPNTRLLCECELYAPATYDDDPQMKEVMVKFSKQTQQRFEEYDERMKTTRQKCKDKCDKEIQKIILKDKLEKQMEQQLTTLETKITTDDIPTCVCEKSLADKVEKFCLNCGMNVGGGVILSSGVLGGIGGLAVNAWKPKALETAIAAANEAGIAAGKIAGDAAGMKVVRFGLEHFGVDELFPGIYNPFVNTGPYTEVTNLGSSILEKYGPTCTSLKRGFTAPTACTKFQLNLGIYIADGTPYGSPYGTPAAEAIPKRLGVLLERADVAAATASKNASETVTAAIKARETALIESGFNNSITSIYVSIIAIAVIVLIMVIIYLILRYRRKKRMKKKHQYIKLLEE